MGFARAMHALRALLATVVLTGSSAALAAALDTWYWRNPLPQGNGYEAVAYGNGVFVAVGGESGGVIVTSADSGATWTVRSVDIADTLRGVAYGNGTWVAVGLEGRILSSADGVNWTVRSSGTDRALTGVAYGNGTFIAVGAEGTILTSADGIAWTRQAPPTLATLLGIAFGNGNFVAVSAPGTVAGEFLISGDGGMWAVVSTGSLDTLRSIAYGNGVFVAVGSRGAIRTSPNGFDWTERVSNTTRFLNAVAYGDGIFYAVGNSNTVLTSADAGASWVVGSGPVTLADWSGVAYGGGSFVVVDRLARIYTFDGTNPVVRSQGTEEFFSSVAYGGGSFMAIGRQGRAHTSPDGITWTAQAAIPDCDSRDVAFGNGLFVQVCLGGAISWCRRTPAPRGSTVRRRRAW